jgi:hypothetical protein
MGNLLRSLALDALASKVKEEVHEAIRRAAVSIALYAAAGLFALAALAFAYVVAYDLMAPRVGDWQAAAILVGVNLLIVLIILAARSGMVKGGRRKPSRPPLGLSAPATAATAAGLDAGLALGGKIGGKIREAAPQIVLAAGVLGLLIGLRPQLLGLFQRKDRTRQR